MEGDARVNDRVRARGVSSRIDNESGRVDGVIECHVEGDGLAMVDNRGYRYRSMDRIDYRLRLLLLF